MATTQGGGTKNVYKTNFAMDSQIVPFYTGGKVQLTSNGRHLFCTCDGTVKIVAVETGKTVATIGEEEDAVMNFIQSPNGDTIVAALTSGLFKQWDWQPSTMTPAETVLTGDETASEDVANSCEYVCKLVKTWRSTHKGPISSLAIDKTGTLLTTGGTDSTVKVWDIVRQYITHNLKGIRGVVRVIEYLPSPDKYILFGSGDDYHIRAWDLQTSDCIAVLEGHLSAVTCLAFTDDCLQMISSGRDQVVICWDIENPVNIRSTRTIPVFEAVESVIAIEPAEIFPAIGIEESGKFCFITAGNKGVLRVWSSAGKLLFTQKSAIAETKGTEEDVGNNELVIVRAFYAAATKSIVVITFEHNIIFYRLTDLSLEKQLVGYNDDILDVTYLCKDDTSFAVATNSIHIKVFEMSTLDCKLLRGHTDIVLALDTFSSNPLMIASASKDNSVRIWSLNVDTKDISCVAIGQGHTHDVGSIACSKLNARFVVSGSHDTCIKLFHIPKDLTDRTQMTSLASTPKLLNVKWTQVAHEKDVNSICVSPNDKLLATGSQDKLAKIWNVKDGTLLGTLRGHRRGIWCVQFSPVDQVVVSSSADGHIKIWSISDCSCVKTFEGHECSVLKVSFVSRGMQLLSSASDGLIKLWTIKSNECIKTLDGHSNRIWALKANRSESSFISGGSDSKIVIWKDVTKLEKAEEQKKLEDAVQQEQELQNLLQQKKFSNALSYCVRLEQPGRALRVVQELLDLPEGGDQLDQTIQTFCSNELDVLLRFVSSWNTNSRTSYEAQLILNIVLRRFSSADLIKLPNIKNTVEALLPYTQRHFERYGRLVQEATFVEYTWQRMKMSEKINSEK